jgi:DNA-binding CsgD family transcriptional regulator
MGLTELPIRGRDRELAAVRSALQGAATGTGAVIVVEGGSGMGKTRLLAECTSLAASLGFRVGRGAAEPGRASVALEALLDALFDGPNPLVSRRALRRLQTSSEQLFWLLHDIQALLEEAALRDPLLICLDDLQWASVSCATAMRQLPPRLAALPVAWLMAFRPNQGNPDVRRAKADLLDAGAAAISLQPLERGAVAELAADILGGQPDQRVLEAAERVHGNPFLLVELFRGFRDEGIVAVASGQATLLDDRVPARVAETIQQRLTRMSEDAEQLAILAGSLGRRFSLHDLAALADRSIQQVLGPVSELLHADVFSDHDHLLSFGHDLIREAVRLSVPSSLRRALDRQAVDVLMRRGALPIEVAQQLAESSPFGDEVAIATLLAAAEALAATDPQATADLAGRALDLAPPRHPLRGPLVSCRAIAMFAAGLADDAKRFADTALRQTLPPAEEARVRWTISGMFDLSPDVRAESARTALALPGLGADDRAHLFASLFHNLVVAVRTEEAAQLHATVDDAVVAARSGAGRFAFALADSALLYQLSRFDDALAALDDVARGGLPTQEDARLRLADNFRSSYLIALDRYDEGFDAAERGMGAAQRDRQNWALRMFETWKGRQLVEMGRLAEAAPLLDGRFTVGEAHRIVGMLEAPTVVALGKLRLHTGDDNGARQVAEMATVMLRATAPGVRHHAAWYLALHAMHLGDAAGAHRWLRALGDEQRLRSAPVFPFEVADDPQMMRIAAKVRDAELARAVMELGDGRCNLNPHVTSLQAAAAHARGIWDNSVDDLENAAELFGQGPRALATASAFEDLGAALLRAGEVDRGTTALDRALELTAQAGASWDAARIRRRLRDVGVRRRHTVVHRPRTGWEALTSAELAVAELAAEGCTNREIAERLFVSPHTVNTHLRHVFDKLRITSRVALTRSAQARRPA